MATGVPVTGITGIRFDVSVISMAGSYQAYRFFPPRDRSAATWGHTSMALLIRTVRKLSKRVTTKSYWMIMASQPNLPLLRGSVFTGTPSQKQKTVIFFSTSQQRWGHRKPIGV